MWISVLHHELRNAHTHTREVREAKNSDNCKQRVLREGENEEEGKEGAKGGR